MKTKVLNIEIDNFKKRDLEERLGEAFNGGKKIKIAKVNSEFLLRANKNNDFAETLNNFDYKIADGSGVLWAAKYLSLPLSKITVLRHVQAIWQAVYSGASLVFSPEYCREPIPERFPGVEALLLMLEAAAETGSSVYFFGAEKRVLEKAIEIIQHKYPKLTIAGSHEGYNYSVKEMVEDINKSGAKLLIVALGSPKQEYWICDNMEKLETVKIAVGEGGSLDFIAGSYKRAPRWIQKTGLEWLWRLFVNKSKTPTGSRMKRVWNAVPVFVYTVVKYKIKNGSIEAGE
jgi:N-acetylglucosaminyldiphosphoundecaprenol N-acetyl-beta-D-mannosaminyltransferase